MFGGVIKKTTSRFAVLAAAGFFFSNFGSGTVLAADLGGDCCADLEERVAELEATTVRKGVRQLSMTISGRVHSAVVYWNDGGANANSVQQNDDDAFVTTPSGDSRVSIDGRATIWSGLEAGYRFRFEWNAANRGSVWSQFSRPDDFNDFTEDEVYWFIRDARLGAISVGRRGQVISGVGKVDVSGKVGLPGQIDPTLWGRNIQLRTPGGFLSGIALGGIDDDFTNLGGIYQVDDGDNGAIERQGVRYDSPSIAGFIISADWTQHDSLFDQFGIRLSYANQFGDFRVAGAGGWFTDKNREDNIPGPLLPFDIVPEANGWAASGGIMHVPTGLFVNGGGGRTDYDTDAFFQFAGFASNDDDPYFWYVTLGWQARWLGWGSTTLFGTYYASKNNSVCGGGVLNASGAVDCSNLLNGFSGGDLAGSGFAGIPNGAVDEHEANYWGLGIVQSFDAASLDLYLTYRNFDTDLNSSFGLGDLEDYDVFMAGGIINF